MKWEHQFKPPKKVINNKIVISLSINYMLFSHEREMNEQKKLKNEIKTERKKQHW